ncbi:MAG: LytTR family DNA-binding domain-containing protein [Pseudomonadota bacterium]
MAGLLNIVSSFVAAWGFDRRLLPGLTALSRQLVGNWALLTFALVCLAAILAVEQFRRSKTEAKPRGIEPEVLREVIVKSGKRSLRVLMQNVDWIEAQGNYVALHIGDRMHLLRETLNRLETQIDPDQFVRIHRGTIVSLKKVHSLSSDANGEATLQLANGQAQKVSRRYRKTVRDRWVGL